MEALKAELCATVERGNLTSAIDRMMGIVLDLEQENERLSWRLLRALRFRFGLELGHALSRMSELTPASWAANQAR
jgi:hypothetical protein